MKSRKTGFTLVELLVVIAIIALLLAVLIPSLSKAKAIAKRTMCASQLKQIGIGMSTYANDYDDMMPWSGAESTIHPYVVYRTNHSDGDDQKCQDSAATCVCGAMGKPRPMRLACLYARGQIKDGKVFYCPAGNIDAGYRYDSYIKSQWGNDWGIPHQESTLPPKSSNEWIRSGYGYYPIDTFYDALSEPLFPPYNPDNVSTVQGTNAPKNTATKFSNLSRCYPYVSDTIWYRRTLAHKSGINLKTNIPVNAGINCLFKDGHVIFAKDGPIKIGTTMARLFDNKYWNNFDRPGTEPPLEKTVRAQYMFFNVYRFISP